MKQLSNSRSIKPALTGLLILVFTFSALDFFTGCGKRAAEENNPNEPKSGILILKASATAHTGKNLQRIPVRNGMISIKSAWINIDRIEIEEKADTTKTENGKDKADSDSDSQNLPKTILQGPFSLDISAEKVLFDSAAIYSGYITLVRLVFAVSTRPPFSDKSINIHGKYTPTGGRPISFTLLSEFTENVETHILDKPISVFPRKVTRITVTLDVPHWFDQVDFSNALVENNQIRIDNSYNTALMSAFEANIANSEFVDEK